MEKIRIHSNDYLRRSQDGWLSYEDSTGEVTELGYDPDLVENWAAQEGVELGEDIVAWLNE